jgi:CheY-like chemotaxis protein
VQTPGKWLAGALARGEKMSSSREILIVDDSEEQVAFVSQILENHGYRYAVAHNGVEALTMMKGNPPALVLLDMMMPRKSGVSVLQQMKQSPDLAAIPVIVITGASQVLGVSMKSGESQPKVSYEDQLARPFGEALHDKLEGLSPDALIEKPVDPGVLIAKIKERLP